MGALDIRAFVFVATFAEAPYPLLCSLSRFVPITSIVAFPLPHWYARPVETGFDRPGALVERPREVNRSVRPEMLAVCIRGLHGIDCFRDLARLAVTCLYHSATRDRIVPSWNLRTFNENVWDLTVVAIEGSHLRLQMRPAERARAIDRFMAKIHCCRPESGIFFRLGAITPAVH